MGIGFNADALNTNLQLGVVADLDALAELLGLPATNAAASHRSHAHDGVQRAADDVQFIADDVQFIAGACGMAIPQMAGPCGMRRRSQRAGLSNSGHGGAA